MLTLIGVTYLFAIAQNNGTVDLLVRGAVRLVGGHVAAIPWIMFFVTALLTAIGALSPAAVAIIAPIALTFAARHGINPLLMGMMVIHGAQGGGFSPISVYGVTVNTIVEDEGLPNSSLAGLPRQPVLQPRDRPGPVLRPRRPPADRPQGRAPTRRERVERAGARGHRRCAGHGAAPAPTAAATTSTTSTPTARSRSRVEQILTLVGLVVVAVLALVLRPRHRLRRDHRRRRPRAVLGRRSRRARSARSAGRTILLIAGVLTYVFVLQEAGTIDYVGEAVTAIGAPLLVALLLCYIGGVVSAFASSTAIIGVAISLAVPFLQSGDIGSVGVVVALSVASTIVDVSPFSTNGALVLANAQDVDRDRFYKQILSYAAIVVAAGPFLAWLVFVVVPAVL